MESAVGLFGALESHKSTSGKTTVYYITPLKR